MGRRLRRRTVGVVLRGADPGSSSWPIFRHYAAGVPGQWELIVLGVVLLLLFGSKQLPSLARNLGRGVREVRETVVDVDPRQHLRELEAPREDEHPAARAPGEPATPADRPDA